MMSDSPYLVENNPGKTIQASSVSLSDIAVFYETTIEHGSQTNIHPRAPVDHRNLVASV